VFYVYYQDPAHKRNARSACAYELHRRQALWIIVSGKMSAFQTATVPFEFFKV
jgi:hypothetical protein